MIGCLLQAFVVFGDAEEAQKACLKDREVFCEGDKFGDRYVRVYPTVESDLPDIQECLAAASSAQGQEVSIVRRVPFAYCIAAEYISIFVSHCNNAFRDAQNKPAWRDKTCAIHT